MDETFALVLCKPFKNNTNGIKTDVIVLKSGQKVIIGREKSCDLRIDCIEISRKHVLIDSEDNHWFVTDLQSTNGLFVNNKQLIAFTPYCLEIGDKVSFGPSDQSKLIYKFVDNYCPNKAMVKTSKRKVCEGLENQLVPKRVCNDWQQLFDSELSCVICHELFVSAVNLNCAHTFCQSCIEQWKHSNEDINEDVVKVRADTHCCPVCRQPIVSQNRVLALDNVIEYMVKNSSPKLMAQRRQLIEERKHFKVI